MKDDQPGQSAGGYPDPLSTSGPDGVLDVAHSKSVGKVTVNALSAQIYCCSGLPFIPRGGQARADSRESGLQSAQFALGNAEGCPGETQAYVFTLEATTPRPPGSLSCSTDSA
jgi:hypothetical protein